MVNMYAVKILQENKSIRDSDNNCAHCFVEEVIAGSRRTISCFGKNDKFTII